MFRRAALATTVFLLAAPNAAHGAFPGSNGKIAFDRYNGSAYEVDAVNPDGTEFATLASDAASPAWSADGGQIAFVRDNDVWVMNADGSGQQALTTNGPSIIDGYPAWAPDGTRIVFSSDRDWDKTADPPQPYEASLFVMNADGSGQQRIGKRGFVERYPSWAPDGSVIQFERFTADDPTGSRLVRIAPSGDGDAPSWNSPSLVDESPDWSPDGTRIIWVRRCCDTGGGIGAGPANTPDPAQYQAISPDNNHDWNPVYSPHGAKIAFTHESSDPGLYVANSDGTGRTRIYASGYGKVSWQPKASEKSTAGVGGAAAGIGSTGGAPAATAPGASTRVKPRLRAKSPQRLRRAIVVNASCAQPCASLAGSGKLVLATSCRGIRTSRTKSRVLGLKPAEAKASSRPVRLSLTIPERARKAAASALAKRRCVVAIVTVRAKSAARLTLGSAKIKVRIRSRRKM